MKTKIGSLLASLACIFFSHALSSSAQGTAFTYQGRLNDGASAASGTYDLRFTICDSTNLPGVVIAGPLTNSGAIISNGLFTVALDFGAGVFTGADRWLEVAARTNGAVTFTTLSPRQKIGPTPYAAYAGNVGATGIVGSIADGQLSANIARLNSNLVFTGTVQLSNPSNTFAGSFNGNAAALTNVQFASLVSPPDGTFSLGLSSTMVPGDNVTAMAAIDANADGKMDLVTAHSSSPDLMVWTNNWKGGFVYSYTIPDAVFLSPPTSLVTADLDNDGKADLIAICPGAHDLAIFEARNSFFFPTHGGTDPGPVAVTPISVSLDGVHHNTALAVANLSTVDILLVNESGNFDISFSVALANTPLGITAGDLNGDGKPDLAVVGFDGLTILTNGTSLSFKVATNINLPFGKYVSATDVNGDGKVDLIWGNGGNAAFILTNAGNAQFTLAQTIGLPQDTGFLTADMNADGRLDLVGSSSLYYRPLVMTNDGTGNFSFSYTPDIPGFEPQSAVTVADVNDDGEVDLVTVDNNATFPRFNVLLNTLDPLRLLKKGHLAALNESQVFVGDNTFVGHLAASSLAGDGGGLFDLRADNISSGTLSDAQLSANVALLNANQTFIGTNIFNNASNRFTGNGSGLTGLNADNIFSGTLSDLRLTANIARLNSNQVFTGAVQFSSATGSFTGNGSGLTNIDAATLGSFNNSSFWKVGGSAGANPTNGAFLGTTDNLPLELKVNGQRALRFEPNTSGAPNLIGGSLVNFVLPGSIGATISGGGLATNFSGLPYTNGVTADFGTVGGGLGNVAGSSATVGGGFNNTASADTSTVGGGGNNVASGGASTVAGGSHNFATGLNGTVGGGDNNYADIFGSVGGGSSNRATNNCATVAGGEQNIARGIDSTIGGGVLNSATNDSATVPGGSGNLAGGKFSFAAGQQANALHQGSFVWSDSQNAIFASTAVDQFNVRAKGGVRLVTSGGGMTLDGALILTGQFVLNHSNGFAMSSLGNFTIDAPFIGGGRFTVLTNGNVGVGTNNPTQKLTVVGGALFTSGSAAANQSVSWTPGSGSWSFTSDRATKEHFASVDTQSVLERLTHIPLNEWSYIGYDQRHIGPMAQDFHAQFPFTQDDKTLNDVDLHGVELAAIQGLNQKLEQKLDQKESEITELKAENNSLEKRLAALETIIRAK